MLRLKLGYVGLKGEGVSDVYVTYNLFQLHLNKNLLHTELVLSFYITGFTCICVNNQIKIIN